MKMFAPPVLAEDSASSSRTAGADNLDPTDSFSSASKSTGLSVVFGLHRIPMLPVAVWLKSRDGGRSNFIFISQHAVLCYITTHQK